MKKLGAVFIGLMIAAVYLIGVGPPFAGATTTPTPGVVRGFFTSAAIPNLREGSLTYGSMDNQGNQRVIFPPGSTFPGALPVATYSATTVTAISPVFSGAPVLSLCGSSTKTIRVQRAVLTFSPGNVVSSVILARTTSTATSGGTPVVLAVGRLDQNDAAPTAVANAYSTTGPTGGTVAATLYAQASTTASPGTVDLNFSVRTTMEAPTLRGTAQCFEVSQAAGNPYMVSVTWTEE